MVSTQTIAVILVGIVSLSQELVDLKDALGGTVEGGEELVEEHAERAVGEELPVAIISGRQCFLFCVDIFDILNCVNSDNTFDGGGCRIRRELASNIFGISERFANGIIFLFFLLIEIEVFRSKASRPFDFLISFIDYYFFLFLNQFTFIYFLHITDHVFLCMLRTPTFDDLLQETIVHGDIEYILAISQKIETHNLVDFDHNIRFLDHLLHLLQLLSLLIPIEALVQLSPIMREIL
jgi:hypothetical protein